MRRPRVADLRDDGAEAVGGRELTGVQMAAVSLEDGADLVHDVARVALSAIVVIHERLPVSQKLGLRRQLDIPLRSRRVAEPYASQPKAPSFGGHVREPIPNELKESV